MGGASVATFFDESADELKIRLPARLGRFERVSHIGLRTEIRIPTLVPGWDERQSQTKNVAHITTIHSSMPKNGATDFTANREVDIARPSGIGMYGSDHTVRLELGKLLLKHRNPDKPDVVPKEEHYEKNRHSGHGVEKCPHGAPPFSKNRLSYYITKICFVQFTLDIPMLECARKDAMNRTALFLLAASLVWGLASWQWYTCSIKGLCDVGAAKAQCSPLLTQDIKRGGKNDPAEVRRLQGFLNAYEGAGLAVSGVYGMRDAQAVEHFQWKYRDTVLTPWGETEPTAYVHMTTRSAVNSIVCAHTLASVTPADYKTTNANPMFQTPVTSRFDMSDATGEIIIMLLGAFILGWLVRQVLGSGFLKDLLAPRTGASVPSPVVVTTAVKKDDLKIVEGIGPKIEQLLKDNGIQNWNDLANATPKQLRDILVKGGDRFALAEPTTWPDQAALANEGRFEELKQFKGILLAGRTS